MSKYLSQLNHDQPFPLEGKYPASAIQKASGQIKNPLINMSGLKFIKITVQNSRVLSWQLAVQQLIFCQPALILKGAQDIGTGTC